MLIGDRSRWSENPSFDMIGIGFGPSNLGLSVALHEMAEGDGEGLNSLFLERKEKFIWHPEMLLDGARIQVSYHKDLVTLRNPRSKFTFINYLWEKGRLVDFLNLEDHSPSRAEFNDYYSWVAAQMDEMVEYGHEVQEIAPVFGKRKEVNFLRVTSRKKGSDEEKHFLTRNLVLETGATPSVPRGVDLKKSKRVIHTSNFLLDIEDRFPDRAAPYRFVVVGAGQSGAEIFRYLFTEYPNANVTATFRRHAYKPADASQFVNEVYNPEMVDVFYGLDRDDRQKVIDAHYDTNYAVVDASLISDIYAHRYQRKVQGQNGIEVRPLMNLDLIVEDEDQVVAEFTDVRAQKTEKITADGIVLATGYTRPKKHPLLSQLEPFLQESDSGSYAVDRDYRLRSNDAFLPDVFLQGFCEGTHGISDPVLSVLPNRTGEIANAIAGKVPAGNKVSGYAS